MEALVAKNPGIVTFTGRVIDPINPDHTAIDIRDIAHALGNICRFTGHVSKFYSVAEHSYHASFLVPEDEALDALMHDAPEAYISDIARPVKHGLGFGPAYREAEARLAQAVADAFGVAAKKSEAVQYADELLLANEIRQLMPANDEIYGTWAHFPDLEFELECLPPQEAKHRFMLRWNHLIRTEA